MQYKSSAYVISNPLASTTVYKMSPKFKVDLQTFSLIFFDLAVISRTFGHMYLGGVQDQLDSFTVAINELLYLKNAGAQISLFFTSYE